jgi:hypothetical protein
MPWNIVNLHGLHSTSGLTVQLWISLLPKLVTV